MRNSSRHFSYAFVMMFYVELPKTYKQSAESNKIYLILFVMESIITWSGIHPLAQRSLAMLDHNTAATHQTCRFETMDDLRQVFRTAESQLSNHSSVVKAGNESPQSHRVARLALLFLAAKTLLRELDTEIQRHDASLPIGLSPNVQYSQRSSGLNIELRFNDELPINDRITLRQHGFVSDVTGLCWTVARSEFRFASNVGGNCCGSTNGHDSAQCLTGELLKELWCSADAMGHCTMQATQRDQRAVFRALDTLVQSGFIRVEAHGSHCNDLAIFIEQ